MQSTDWEAARRLTREWLQHEGTTASRLANRANVQRSVVTRFLNGQPITPQTAARLCDAMQVALGPSERITLMEKFGLSRFSQMAGVAETNVLPASQADKSFNFLAESSILAARLWSQALEMANISWMKAIPLFFEAERAFGISSVGALAGLQGAQILINIGDANGAEREAIRIQTACAGEMDSLTRAHLASVRGWLAFDQGDYGQALKWFGQNIALPPGRAAESMRDGGHHFSGRILLEMSRSPNEQHQAARLLQQAETHMRTSLAMKLQRGAPASQIGFEHLRLMEILDEQGRHDEARLHRRKANEIFAGEGAELHVLMHMAEQDLDEGNTKSAIKTGMAGLENWREYSNGFARAAGIVAEGKLEEGELVEALRYAALAHAYNPNFNHHSHRPRGADMAHVASRLLAHQLGRREHNTLIQKMQEDAQSRQKEFANLDRAPVDHTPALYELFDTLLA